MQELSESVVHHVPMSLTFSGPTPSSSRSSVEKIRPPLEAMQGSRSKKQQRREEQTNEFDGCLI